MPDLIPPAVILDKSQMAENIGAVARVMANFGLSDLRLVSPRDGWPQERAWATASGAEPERISVKLRAQVKSTALRFTDRRLHCLGSFLC